MNGIIDIHTHAFPDALADRAMKQLLSEGDVKAYLDGRLSSLIESMDQNNIERAVICSIATRPSQFEPIMKWSEEIRSERIIPFPSMHPDDASAVEKVHQIADEGFLGIKLHPYYQEFYLDEPRMEPIYDAVNELGLALMVHTGFDPAFPYERRADPVRIVSVMERSPGLKLIASHMGAWDDWDEVERAMLGKEIYMDVSYAIEQMDYERAKRMVSNHPPEFLLFGTDLPWTDQGEIIELVKSFDLGSLAESLIFRENAIRLLNQ
jgi:hypothetical protein